PRDVAGVGGAGGPRRYVGRVGGACGPPPPVAAPLVPRCALLPAATPRVRAAALETRDRRICTPAYRTRSESGEAARCDSSGSGEPARCDESGSGDPAAPRRQSLLRSYLAARSFPRR